MKHFLLLFMTFIAINTYSQYVKTDSGLIDLREQPITYIQLVAKGKILSLKVNISVDYGQKQMASSVGEGFLIDSTGKKLTFNSHMHAMNYLASYGWEYLDAYAISAGNQNVYHYTFINRKKTLKPGDVTAL